MPGNFEVLPQYTVIRDTYTVDSLLGQGAFGAVYKVRHKFLGIQALKVFYPVMLSEKITADFLNEAVILSKITHPNVVRVFEANQFDYCGKSIPYVVMEYLPSGTLDAYIRKKNILESYAALQIQMMICRGLARMHELSPPIIHRDVKPQNIMLDLTGPDIVVKVSDFGQAKGVDPVTKLAESAGTLAYMAPEGFWNYKSPASDVYSAGMIFYTMLTGKGPFKIPQGAGYRDTKEIERALRIARGAAVKPPSELNGCVDKSLDRIVLTALESDIRDRYQNAQEFLHALEQYALKQEGLLQKRIDEVLVLGRQYRDLPAAISEMETILRSLPENKKKIFSDRYNVFLDRWKKGIIM